ncbi:MAG: hypothetical protein AAF362_10750 [Pseudomonadota bacterium]
MPVVGRHAYILAQVGKSVDVSPFTPQYKPITAELVDAALAYECPFTSKTYILVLRNALHVPSMKNNLIPPFMMREAGITVSEVPKIHVDDPSVNDHAIVFEETGFRIPLQLWGIFSYFPTSKPKASELTDPSDVYLLTPTTWNPHSDAYAFNEENMLDWEGNMRESKYREQHLVLDEVPDDDRMVSSLAIGDSEQQIVDQVCGRLTLNDYVAPLFDKVPKAADEVSQVLAKVSAILNPATLYRRLAQRQELGQFQMSVGSTTAMPDNSPEESGTQRFDDEESHYSEEEVGDDGSLELDVDPFEDDFDLEEFMASATSSSNPRGVDAEHLSKVWRISHKQAEQTLNTTTQHSIRTQDPTLSRNYGTNDRMLRYKRIDDYFFMDTFFATKKGGKSSRGNTCCQLFVTDKGFVYVVPMKRKSEALQAVKQFAKEIGAPDSFVCDMSGEQTSQELRKFLSDIGTTLRALEEGTPWCNKAELYIGLLKEATRKDMREADSPLVFWDYCLERRARIHKRYFQRQLQDSWNDTRGYRYRRAWRYLKLVRLPSPPAG